MRKYLCKASAIALSALMVASYTPASAYAATKTVNNAEVVAQQDENGSTDPVENVDTTALQATIEKADALQENDYTKATWDKNISKINSANEAAKAALEKKESQSAVDTANKNLTDAMKALVKAYSTDKLEALIEKAENLKEDDYTAESWKDAKLSIAIAGAKEAIAERASKTSIHTVSEAIQNAIDKLVSNSITVGRGIFAKKLKPGTYKMPIELLNAGHAESTKDYTSSDYMTHFSMAHGCFTGEATLVIHEDGTATLTTGVQAVKAYSTEGAADDWTIYEDTQGYLDGKVTASKGARYYARVDEQKALGGKKKPSKITFEIPDLKQNVVVSRMRIEVMNNIEQDACIGLDWANIEKVSDTTSATSTFEKNYKVNSDTLTQLENIKAGKTVKLNEDVTLSDDLSIKGGTIDLNGHTLDQADNLIMIKGDVKITDSSADKKGKITASKYSENEETYTTISTQKGSLTVENIAIEGQIGNQVVNGTSSHLKSIPRVNVKLSNCVLTNALGKSNIDLQFIDDGSDVILNNCTADTEITVGSGHGETIAISDSTIAKLTLYGDNCTIKNVKSTKTAFIGTAKAEVEDSEFDGIAYLGKDNITLKNTKSTNTFNITGTGTATIVGGVYESAVSSAISSQSAPVDIVSGYFKGKYKASTISAPYTTPDGKILGEVTDGEYKGYLTVVDGKEAEVEDPVMTIYNADGTVSKQLSEDDIDYALGYAKAGQTVKLNADIESFDQLGYFKDITIDLNGYTLSVDYGITGNKGSNCRVVDSSKDKSGKFVAAYYLFNTTDSKSTMSLDNVSCESLYVQGSSSGKVYVINGSNLTGIVGINAIMGGGKTIVQDSTWTMGKDDPINGTEINPSEVLTNATRTSQYTIEKTGDSSFKVTVNELGKEMRAFEAIDSSAYTKASYNAVKAVYDEIDNSADDDIQGDTIAAKAKELRDAVAKLEKTASKDALNKLDATIKKAKTYSSKTYTAASYKVLSDAVAKAEKLVKSGDASEKAASDAQKAIETAIKGLKKAPAKPVIKIVKGKTYTVSGSSYKVTYASVKSGNVTFTGMKNKKVKTVTIPATVKINGVTCKVTAVGDKALKNYKSLKKVTVGYNVTTIGKYAFQGDKNLKSIVVKSTSLKKVGSKALSGIHKKATVKVPSKKLKAYKKLFKNKGQKKTVKIKK